MLESQNRELTRKNAAYSLPTITLGFQNRWCVASWKIATAVNSVARATCTQSAVLRSRVAGREPSQAGEQKAERQVEEQHLDRSLVPVDRPQHRDRREQDQGRRRPAHPAQPDRIGCTAKHPPARHHGCGGDHAVHRHQQVRLLPAGMERNACGRGGDGGDQQQPRPAVEQPGGNCQADQADQDAGSRPAPGAAWRRPGALRSGTTGGRRRRSGRRRSRRQTPARAGGDPAWSAAAPGPIAASTEPACSPLTGRSPPCSDRGPCGCPRGRQPRSGARRCPA